MFKAEFQSFEERAEPGNSAARMAKLRAELARRKLDGFIVTTADQHQNEYVPPSEERLAWLTGFTGSLGAAVIAKDKAALFVDGRYTLQAKDQTDGTVFAIEHLVEHPPHEWIAENLPKGATLGYDPWRTTLDGAERLQKAVERAGGKLKAVEGNPVDAIWTERPAPPLASVKLHDLKFAGVAPDQKLARIREAIAKDKLDCVVLSDPASIAWTFNIRGGDVGHTPIALAWALVPREGEPVLFIDPRKLSTEVRNALARLADLRDPTELEATLAKLSKNKTVRLDHGSAPKILAACIEAAGGKVAKGADPVMRMKAVKNATEIEGARAAHLRDGAALVRFLAWFDKEAPQGKLTEIDAVAALETFRRETRLLKDISFPSIAGSGPNGAIVHYRVTEKSNRIISPGELFLIDSGAQYEDGTTDVTRTLAVGEPTLDMRTHFTLVLKGHIAIAMATFPEGTTGAQLDPFARRALWAAGLDFDHGTGHGVGSYLSVHEGPARISKLGTAKLEAGMILSNEPGFYKTGAYGIRIENLELIVPVPAPAGAEKNLLGFEPLTLAPIDRRLIDPALLSPAENAWVDGYHAKVRTRLSAELDAAARSWLEAATAPLPN
jgi:Xaa-Pro aminopeptidase